MRMWLLALLAALLTASPAGAATLKALFDNYHAETAGNADWVIDTHQPVPFPDQSGIGPNTPGTFWVGAISSWGVDLVKRGYTVTTNTAPLTYQNLSNPYDLSNYDVLIVDEPNTLFSSAEAAAILNFVHDGGGLVAVSDHYASDRNNDGFDSPMIWNALDPTHLLGVHCGVSGDANNNFTQTSTNVNPSPSDSVTHGSVGVVTGLAFHNGTSFTLYPAVNPSVRGEVWMTGVSQTSTAGLMAASSYYGSGRFFIAGDSSPADDGSAAPGNSSIYDGWGEAGATDSTLFLNATLWASRRAVAADQTPPTVSVLSPAGGEVWKAGSTHAITWTATDDIGVATVDLAWSTDAGASFPNPIATGIANTGSYAWAVPNTPGSAARVQVTAHDAAGNAGADVSAANFTIDTWTITASAGPGGGIAPAGAVAVAEGASQGFTIAAAAGFGIADVVVDGGSVGALTGYSFTGVAANHTIGAAFADIAAPVVLVGSPNGGEAWDMGSVHDITWSASDNVAVDSVNVDCSLSGAAGPWIAVAHGLGNTGTTGWTLPGQPTDSALVRVTAYDHALNTGADASDGLFRIVDPNLAVETGGPAVLGLARPMPNPSAGDARVRFSLPAAGRVRLEILDLSGRLVRREEAEMSAGYHEWRWEAGTLSGTGGGAGLYFVRLVTPWGTRVQRLARLR